MSRSFICSELFKFVIDRDGVSGLIFMRQERSLIMKVSLGYNEYSGYVMPEE